MGVPEGPARSQNGGEYEFGAFRYDAAQKQLFRDGSVVALMPKAVDTLQALLERRGRVVEKSELMNLVWPGTRVEEVALARNISLLRKALGDEAESYIETIPKRGYRFAAESRAAEAEKPPLKQWRWPAALTGAAVAIVAGLVYWQFYTPSRYLPRGDRFANLAVVPFDTLGSGRDSFTDGLNALLAVKLAGLDRVHVISPSTVERHRRAGVSMGLMGRVLGLDALVEGTVQRIGGRLRVTARLVDVHTGKLIWAQSYDYTDADPADAQTAAAHAIAAEVGAHLAIHGRFQP